MYKDNVKKIPISHLSISPIPVSSTSAYPFKHPQRQNK